MKIGQLNAILALLFSWITSANAILLEAFYCPIDQEVHPVSEIADCEIANSFASLILGAPTLVDAREAIVAQDIATIASMSHSRSQSFWSIILTPDENCSEQSGRALRWAQEVQAKACQGSTSESLCAHITGALVNYYLHSSQASSFVQLPNVGPIAGKSMKTLHEELFATDPNHPTALLQQHVAGNIGHSSKIESPSPLQCHLNRYIDAKAPESEPFISGHHHDEILNFIWFGPNLPKQYADNLFAWADAYPTLTIVLWYSPVNLDEKDLKAYNVLNQVKPNLHVRNIDEAGLEKLKTDGTNPAELLHGILTFNADIKPGVRYASASDFARVALIAKGSQAVAIKGQDTSNKTMIYLDLDVTFESTCGFAPLSRFTGETFINIFDSDILEKVNVISPVDILAAKQAQHPNIMILLRYLTEQYEDVFGGRDKLLPIAFDGAMDDVLQYGSSELHRFPILWSLSLQDSDRSWKDDPKNLFSRKWKDEYL